MAYPSVTNTFANSTTADATQVNQNFTDLINGLSDGTKDLSINALTCAGAATLNGNVTLGNASSDDITFTGSLASSIPIKTTFSYDFGSATIGLKSIYLGSNDSTAHSVRLIAGAIGTSYTITLPTGVPAAAGMVMKFDASATASFESRLTYTKAAKTGAYTATTSDEVITCDATTAAFTVTLPAAASSSGKVLIIQKIDSALNAVTIDGNASETVGGATTTTLSTQYESIEIYCDGSNWLILSRNYPRTIASFSPSYNWTTNTTATTLAKRDGHILEIWGRLEFSGAPDNVILAMTLPSGYTIDTAAITDSAESNGASPSLGYGKLFDSSQSKAFALSPIYNSSTTLRFVDTTGNALNSALIELNMAHLSVGASDRLDFVARIPISGWK